jgi:hypothetical protein
VEEKVLALPRSGLLLLRLLALAQRVEEVEGAVQGLGRLQVRLLGQPAEDGVPPLKNNGYESRQLQELHIRTVFSPDDLPM